MAVKFFKLDRPTPETDTSMCVGISINDNEDIEGIVVGSRDYAECSFVSFDRLNQLWEHNIIHIDNITRDKDGNYLCMDIENGDLRKLPTWKNFGNQSMILHDYYMRREEPKFCGASYVAIAKAKDYWVLFCADDFALIAATTDYIRRVLSNDESAIPNLRVSRNADGSVRAVLPRNKNTIKRIEYVPFTFEYHISGLLTLSLSAFDNTKISIDDKYIKIKIKDAADLGDFSKTDMYIQDITYNADSTVCKADVTGIMTISYLKDMDFMCDFIREKVHSMDMGQLQCNDLKVRFLNINPTAILLK